MVGVQTVESGAQIHLVELGAALGRELGHQSGELRVIEHSVVVAVVRPEELERLPELSLRDASAASGSSPPALFASSVA